MMSTTPSGSDGPRTVGGRDESRPVPRPAVYLIVSLLLLGAVGAAWLVAGSVLGLGAALAGLLLLYLLGFRSILREELEQRRELEERVPLVRRLAEAAAPRAPAAAREELAPGSGLRRRFSLGTVAILRGALEPEQLQAVAREQERRRTKRFGLVAVELGLLTLAQLADLVRAQREGRFTVAEMRRARKRLAESRQPGTTPAGSPDLDGPRANPGAGPSTAPGSAPPADSGAGHSGAPGSDRPANASSADPDADPRPGSL